MSDDKPLSPAEIAAWARDWVNFHEPLRELGAELVGAERVDLDIRAMRQVAETFDNLRAVIDRQAATIAALITRCAAAEAARGLVTVTVTGGRHFATDSNGRVNLPDEHIRRSVANDLAQQFAPMLRISEKWDGYRLRIYAASMTIIMPEGENTDGRETENRSG